MTDVHHVITFSIVITVRLESHLTSQNHDLTAANLSITYMYHYIILSLYHYSCMLCITDMLYMCVTSLPLHSTEYETYPLFCYWFRLQIEVATVVACKCRKY